MKTTTRVLLLSLAASIIHALPTEEVINNIRADYNAIESASLQSQTIRFAPSDDPMEGTLTRYYRNDELVKIDFSYVAGDHGGADESYYYKQGNLFFVFISDSSWAFTGKTSANGESETIDTFREHRIYIAGNQPVRYLLKSASSRNPDGGAKALAQVENQEQSDPEFTSSIISRALKATNVTSSAGIEGLLSE